MTNRLICLIVYSVLFNFVQLNGISKLFKVSSFFFLIVSYYVDRIFFFYYFNDMTLIVNGE